MSRRIETHCPKGHLKAGRGRKRVLANGEIRVYPICLVCRRERKRQYRARHPERVRESARAIKLRLKYGISAAEYEALTKIQRGRCAICGRKPEKKPLSVDHKGTLIRGLLCHRCNFAAGLLDDLPERAIALAKYLLGENVTRLIERGEPMKITIQSTTKKVTLNGVEARIWEGTTESGSKVHAYITRIALPNDAPPDEHARFEAELRECATPSPEVAAIPLRMIL